MSVTKKSIAGRRAIGQACPDHHSRVDRRAHSDRSERDSIGRRRQEIPGPARAGADGPSRAEAEAAVETLLRWIGEDPCREGLRETPARVVKAYEELFGGYRLEAGDVLGRTFKDVSGYDDMVLVRDIDFHSHCEHHMVPIIGKAHVAYLPDGRVLGLSKIARLVDIYGRRLQTQESMTAQIATAIAGMLRRKGVAVMIEAEHMCMSMRGIRSKGSLTITTSFQGAFAEDRELKDRFLCLPATALEPASMSADVSGPFPRLPPHRPNRKKARSCVRASTPPAS